MTISWNTVILKLPSGFLQPVSEELWRDKPSIRKPVDPWQLQKKHEQWASTGRRMDCVSRQNSSLIGPKNPPKFEIWLYLKKCA